MLVGFQCIRTYETVQIAPDITKFGSSQGCAKNGVHSYCRYIFFLGGGESTPPSPNRHTNSKYNQTL